MKKWYQEIDSLFCIFSSLVIAIFLCLILIFVDSVWSEKLLPLITGLLGTIVGGFIRGKNDKL